MRKLIAIPTLLVLVVFGSSGCGKSKVNNCCVPEPHFAGVLGKLVVSAPCSHYVIQVLLGDIDSSKYINNWVDPTSNTTYPKVFTVANVCNFDGASLHQGDTLVFELGEPVPMNCMVCQIYYPTPSISNTVINVHKYR